MVFNWLYNLLFNNKDNETTPLLSTPDNILMQNCNYKSICIEEDHDSQEEDYDSQEEGHDHKTIQHKNRSIWLSRKRQKMELKSAIKNNIQHPCHRRNKHTILQNALLDEYNTLTPEL